MLAALAGTVGKAAFGAVKHVVGASHVTGHLNEIPTSLPQLVEAAGLRGTILFFAGLWVGNDEFRSHIDAAIKAVFGS